MASSANTISIIIPAFNEQEHIGNTLGNLRMFIPEIETEVIVVDNGSTDQTADIVKQHNITCLSLPEGNISAVRNFGVRNSTGDVLIFIDADVNVTKMWKENIHSAVARIANHELQILGSRCHATSSDTVLSKYWYSRLNLYQANYINGAHLITSRSLFDKINGFDESMVTAEDYDFCQRAKKAEAIVEELPQLVVTHPGYPDNIIGFIKREIWHGSEDLKSISSILNSKMAWVSVTNLILFVLAIFASIIYSEFEILLIYPLSMLVICITLTVYKFGKQDLHKLPATALIFFMYVWGRSLSFIVR